ncbi:MAG: hypothetical protein ACRD51_07230 [Candidatus Acidiferrum sp.]
MADITDRVGVLGVELRNLQSVSGLKIADRSVIETTVLNKLVRPPSNYMQQLLDQVEIDLRSGTPALQIAIEKQVKTRFGDSAPALAINVEEVEKRTFRIGNNIPELFGISDEISDQILRLAVSAVTHLNHRVAEMSAYSAITGFEESESNLLFGKFAGILRPLNPNLQEDQFTRVATIAGFPELIAGKRVDVERLLTVRDSAELREFRDWLSKLDSLSDEQIREMLNSVRQRIGSFARSGVGKTLRLAVTSAVGLVGVLPGLAAGAFDTFLVEKLFPNSGVVAFLTKSYPSLFDSP